MPAAYLETSAVLRALLERGMTPDLERRIAAAPVLVTSRLPLVESQRVLLRLRIEGTVAEAKLRDASRALDELWARCEMGELTPAVCDLAGQVAPARPLRTLDALHLATSLLARRRIGDVDLPRADRRPLEAAGAA